MSEYTKVIEFRAEQQPVGSFPGGWAVCAHVDGARRILQLAWCANEKAAETLAAALSACQMLRKATDVPDVERLLDET